MKFCLFSFPAVLPWLCSAVLRHWSPIPQHKSLSTFSDGFWGEGVCCPSRVNWLKNSTSLGYTEKFLTICHTDLGPDMKNEAKQDFYSSWRPKRRMLMLPWTDFYQAYLRSIPCSPVLILHCVLEHCIYNVCGSYIYKKFMYVC